MDDYNMDTYQTYKKISQNNFEFESVQNILNDSSDKKKNNFYSCDDQDTRRHTGQLKFFDENKNYGFLSISLNLVKEDDMSDIFVHYDDLYKANMVKE